MHIAVTPDEMRYVPEEIETKIDVGQRACTSGMMIEIALRLGLEHLLETEKFQTYFQSIAITALTRCSPAPSGSRANSIF